MIQFIFSSEGLTFAMWGCWASFSGEEEDNRIQEFHVVRIGGGVCVCLMCMGVCRGKEGNKQEDCINLWSAGEGRAQAGRAG